MGLNTTKGKWGKFAKSLLDPKKQLFTMPRMGKLDDKAHPPIHPVKNPPLNKMDGSERRLFELICRHFLAQCSTDAQIANTRV